MVDLMFRCEFGHPRWCQHVPCPGLQEDGMCGMGLGRSCKGFLHVDVGTLSGSITRDYSPDEWAVLTEHLVVSDEPGKP
jgi:hypothetical protein